jgi:hypothetical protein
MHVMDAFTPDLPAHLVGAFDIVHIRAIVSAVKGNAVEPLLKNLVKMLSGLHRPPCNSSLAFVPDVSDNHIWAFMRNIQHIYLPHADILSLLRRAWRVSPVGRRLLRHHHSSVSQAGNIEQIMR